MIRSPKRKDRETQKIERLLGESFPDFPEEYPPEAYRYNPASIRLRLVSPRFKGKNRVEREKMVLPVLKKHLSEETWQDLTLVLLLTPEELGDSLTNLEFKDPTPSPL